MRLLIASIGSAGDIHPFIAVGLAMRARGHEVLFLANPHFRERIERAGLAFAALGKEEDYLRMVTDPALVHPTRGPFFVFRELIAGTCRPMYEEVTRLAREFKPDLVFRHHIAFGARWACEKLGLPCAAATLSPIFWFSRIDPPVFKRGVFEHAPAWLRRARMRFGRVVVRWFADPIFNPIRRELGLPAQREVFITESRAGAALLGLWSPRYRGPRDDDPAHARICGFCFFDRAAEAPADLDAFLRASDPRRPVVVTMGSSVVHHARELYEHAAAACAELGVPGALLVGSPEYVPRGLPGGVGAFTYAPYSAVFPRAAAVVHHGGIGTTAAAMNAGVPAVIVPFANDEFDNAARARRLGVSVTLHSSKVSRQRLADALSAVLNDRAASERADALGELVRAESGAEQAADELERVAGVSPGAAEPAAHHPTAR